MPKKRTADEYTADDGFVVDAPEDDDHEKEEVGQRKKQKVKSAARVGKSAGAGGGGGNVPGGGSKDKDGADFWEISGKRRLTLSEYGGKRMINIREYYEKNGESLPGKKGISLTTEQFDTIITLLPHIESVLKQKGTKIARPAYGPAGGLDGKDEEDGEEDDDEEEEEEDSKRKGAKKKNFEETSEED